MTSQTMHKVRKTNTQRLAGKEVVYNGFVGCELAKVRDIIDGMLIIPSDKPDERRKAVIYLDLVRALTKLIAIEEVSFCLEEKRCNEIFVQTKRLRKVIECVANYFSVSLPQPLMYQ